MDYLKFKTSSPASNKARVIAAGSSLTRSPIGKKARQIVPLGRYRSPCPVPYSPLTVAKKTSSKNSRKQEKNTGSKRQLPMEISELESTTQKKSKAVRHISKKVAKTGKRSVARASSSILAPGPSKSPKNKPTAPDSLPAETFLTLLKKIDARLDDFQADMNAVKENQTRLEALITQSNAIPRLTTTIAPAQPFFDAQMPVMPASRVAGGQESEMEKYMKQMLFAKMFQNAFS